jgi:tetratricopeptide (TPR) repeat protein
LEPGRGREIEPKLADAYRRAALEAADRCDVTAAVAHINRAFRIEPASAKNYETRGTVSVKLCRWDEAIVDLQEAMRRDLSLESLLRSELATAIYNRGLRNLRTGRIAEADFDMQRVRGMGFSIREPAR